MTVIRGISSMATRLLLAELAALHREQTGIDVSFESVGGVDAAKRVQAGEAFDVVVLASDAIAKLEQEGRVARGSRVELVRSGVGVAVKADARQPDIGSEDALKRAVLEAPTIGYSTGPSGTSLLKLFERWGVAAELKDRLVQAPPGIPVGSLVADGKVAIGFQQLAELIHQPGIDVIGPMPPGVEINTIFAGGVCTASAQPDAARELLRFMASPGTAEAKRRQGMESA